MHLTHPEAFAAYTLPAGADVHANLAMCSKIAAEIVALTACEQRVADCAGGHFTNCRNFPNYGLDGSAHSNPRLANEASWVLDMWIAAKVAGQMAVAA